MKDPSWQSEIIFKKSQISKYDHQQLKFTILESDAVINHQGKIEVKIVLSNKNEFDWDSSIKIKGSKDQEEIRDLDLKIGKVIKSGKVNGVKFIFAPSVNISHLKELCLYFAEESESRKEMRVSETFLIKLEVKKKSLFSLCSFF